MRRTESPAFGLLVAHMRTCRWRRFSFSLMLLLSVHVMPITKSRLEVLGPSASRIRRHFRGFTEKTVLCWYQQAEARNPADAASAVLCWPPATLTVEPGCALQPAYKDNLGAGPRLLRVVASYSLVTWWSSDQNST